MNKCLNSHKVSLGIKGINKIEGIHRNFAHPAAE